MTREELIAYDRWLTENKWGSSEIITPEQAADLYLAKHPLPPAEGAEKSCSNCRFHNSLTYHDKMWCRDCQQLNHYEQKQPPAEGAEAILHRHIDKQSMDELSVNVWPDMLEAMHEFASQQHPPAEGAEKLKEMEELFNLEQQLDIPMKDRFHLSAKGKELLDAINSLQNKPQPTAEGAEEILASLIEGLGEPDNSIHDHSYEIRPLTVNGKCEWWMFHNGVGSGEPLAQWLQNFATLHAQRIAEKMVSERCKKCKYRGLPDSINEALNSGDGVYRP